MDFAAARKAAEKEGHITGGDYFKLKDGANRLRLVGGPIPHPDEYNGQPNFKWLCYVLDRADGQIKVFFMPHGIYKNIEAFQKSDDYSFDTVPMPYDLTINAEHAGTKEAKYTTVPARKNVAITDAESVAILAKKPLKEVQDAIYAKKGGTREPVAAGNFDPDEIPF